MEVRNLTLRQAAKLLNDGAVTSVELCQAYLERIAEVEPSVQALLSLNKEAVLEQAKASDGRRAAGKALGPFDGIPVTVKDNIAAKGYPCTCASKILKGFVSPYDATVTGKLKAAGFVLMGRANMDEFAMGSSCENSAYQKTRNPLNTDCVPGGSSGGSAAAVAAGETVIALGSDTGGSIRQPAAFCGIVGVKPTYGRVSRFGLVAFASSLDQIGPMSKSVYDAAAMLDVICGADPKDTTSLPAPVPEGGFAKDLEEFEKAPTLKGMRIGIPKEYFDVEGISDGVKKVCADAKEKLKKLRPDESVPAWAFRFLQGIPEVKMILSGMSDMHQIKENIAIFAEDKPLLPQERDVLLSIADCMTHKASLPCTACRYCTSHCPKGLDIPRLIGLYNEHRFTGGGFIAPMALGALPKDKWPSACVGCRSCEKVCPQQIRISEMMKDFTERLRG